VRIELLTRQPTMQRATLCLANSSVYSPCLVNKPASWRARPIEPQESILVTRGTDAMKFWIVLVGRMQSVTRWGDLQNLAHRLNPKRIAVAINVIDQDLSRRSSSVWAKTRLPV
jgi:hypothetical protein